MQPARVWRFALMLAAVLVAAAQAQDTWRSLGPDGGSVYSLAVDPRDARILLAGSGGGLFRSTNSGHSWQRVKGGPAAGDLAFDPFVPGTCYAASQGLWRSSDDGSTWALTMQGVPRGLYAYAVRPLPRRHGFVVALGVVGSSPVPEASHFYALRSTDGGATWRVQMAGLPTGGQWNDVVADPFSADVAYLSSANGLYRSQNGGRSWRQLSLARRFVSKIVPDAFRPGRLWADALDESGQSTQVLLSTDGGLHWRNRTPGDQPNSFLVAGDPARRDHFYLNTAAGLALSTDGGQSWRPVFSGTVLSLVGDRASGTLTAGGGDYGVARSLNGEVWVRFSRGLRARRMSRPALGSGETIWAGDDANRLWVSQDDGATWRSALAAPTPNLYLTGLAADPTSTSVAYVATSNGLYRTRDAGDTWEPAGPEPPSAQAYVASLAMDPSQTSRLYLADGAGLYRTDDGGDNWQLLHAETPGTFPLPVYPVTVSVGTPPVLYGHSPFEIYGHWQDEVFRSMDEGASWVPILPGVPVVTAILVDPSDPQRLWVSNAHVDYLFATITAGAVFRSSDGGAMWDSAPVDSAASPVTGLALDPSDSNVLYASSWGVSVSRDGGATWQPLADGLPPGAVSGLAVRGGTPAELFAATGGGVYALSLP